MYLKGLKLQVALHSLLSDCKNLQKSALTNVNMQKTGKSFFQFFAFSFFDGSHICRFLHILRPSTVPRRLLLRLCKGTKKSSIIEDKRPKYNIFYGKLSGIWDWSTNALASQRMQECTKNLVNKCELAKKRIVIFSDVCFFFFWRDNCTLHIFFVYGITDNRLSYRSPVRHFG